MKQYCRYCIHCCTGNGNWCEAKEKEYSTAYFKRVNNCKLFEFCEMDAFAENPNPYRPRENGLEHLDENHYGPYGKPLFKAVATKYGWELQDD